MEGSTGAWEAHPIETRCALQKHDEIFEGDSVFAVFARASARSDELQTTALGDLVFWVTLRNRCMLSARELIGNAAADRAEQEGHARGWEHALVDAFELAEACKDLSVKL